MLQALSLPPSRLLRPVRAGPVGGAAHLPVASHPLTSIRAGGTATHFFTAVTLASLQQCWGPHAWSVDAGWKVGGTGELVLWRKEGAEW